MKPFSINAKGHFILKRKKKKREREKTNLMWKEKSSKEANVEAISRRTKLTNGTPLHDNWQSEDPIKSTII